MIHFGADYWDRYFSVIFIQKINAFQNILGRVLTSFDNLGEEAKKIAEEESALLFEMPADPDGSIDLASLADMAQNVAIDYYVTMSNMKHGLIGLFTSGLFHLFEQQIFLFYNKGILKYGEKKAIISPQEWEKLKNRLKDERIDLESFESFNRIKILQLVANVIKHGEGHSADKLKGLKPDYFNPLDSLFHLQIEAEMPLAGGDIKIPIEDFDQYCEDVKTFWGELGKKLIEVS